MVSFLVVLTIKNVDVTKRLRTNIFFFSRHSLQSPSMPGAISLHANVQLCRCTLEPLPYVALRCLFSPRKNRWFRSLAIAIALVPLSPHSSVLQSLQTLPLMTASTTPSKTIRSIDRYKVKGLSNEQEQQILEDIEDVCGIHNLNEPGESIPLLHRAVNSVVASCGKKFPPPHDICLFSHRISTATNSP